MKRKLTSIFLLMVMLSQLIPINSSYAYSNTLDYRLWQHSKKRESPIGQFKLDLKRDGVVIDSQTSTITRDTNYNDGETPPDIQSPPAMKAYVGDVIKSTNWYYSKF